MLCHVGSRGAVGALRLELLDFAVSLNREVLEKCLCALLVSVLNLLGGGVHLLLALTLTALSVNQGVNDALINKTGLNEVELVLELGSAEHNAVYAVLGDFLDLRSIIHKVSRSC